MFTTIARWRKRHVHARIKRLAGRLPTERPFDEPTTIPGLRDSEQIDLGGYRAYKRDDLRSARGIFVAFIIGLAIIVGVWLAALWLKS